ncbi:SDR family oxidoreductase [Rhodovulum sp. DZ06]|uniref:SDR family oxidoreductase n=1 Tax=Rhodovulum sp. DZ06 TaxID=3425126 RepID=UPI003D3543CA
MSLKLFDLSGRTALITGGSRGLGLQIAEAYGAAGAKLVLTARKRHELDEAAAHLGAMGAEVATVACDLTEIDTIPDVAAQAGAAFGGIDILVNNAGTSWGAPMEAHPLDGWNKVMTLNVTAPYVLTQEVGKRFMLPAGSGRIVNIASVAGLGGNRADLEMYTIAYNTSKGAMITFTRALATEWGPRGINVNALAPGFFPSKLAQVLMDRLEEKMMPGIPLRRFGGEEDLKGPALLLASDAGRHITGECIAVDGGMMA